MQSLRDKLIQAGLVSKEQAEAEKRPSKQPPTPKNQRAMDAQLRQLATQASVPIEPGDRAFYFQTRKGKLRRLELSEAQAKLLEDGALAVVERPEPAGIEHSLVPARTAQQMLKLSAKSVRFFANPSAPIGCSK